MFLAVGFLFSLLLPAQAQNAKYVFVAKKLNLQEMGVKPTCREVINESRLTHPIVDLSFCRPKDFIYKWIKGTQAHCYEVSADGDHAKWLVKTELSHCKPKETVFVFKRAQEPATFAKLGDKAHECWEKDLETKGEKYSAVAPLEKCRSVSPRVTRMSYLGLEGCYEVDSVLGMDIWIKTMPESDCDDPKAIDSSYRHVVEKPTPVQGQKKKAPQAKTE